MVHVASIHVYVSDYGPSDPRGAYFDGWRVVSGAPMKTRYASRDEAMVGAREVIKNEVLHQMAYAQRTAENVRSAMRACEAAGLELKK